MEELKRHLVHRLVLLALLLAGPAHLFASPRTLPKAQALHFCRLLFYDGEGSVRLLNTYAQNLVTVLCGQARYGDYTAEQVFTGLIFYFDDWMREPFIMTADAERQRLIYDLCSGSTLRIFPHKSGAMASAVSWYAPTLRLPESIDAEHRRYIQEVFTRLNAEVKAEHWETVDAYIDSMIKYQCQFGGNPPSQSPSSYTIIAIFLGMSLACLAVCKVF